MATTSPEVKARRRRSDRAAWLFCLAVAPAVVGLWASAIQLVQVSQRDLFPWLAVGAALLATDLLDAKQRIRQHTITSTATTMVLAIAVAFDRPLSVLLAVVAAMVATGLVRKRTPLKASFNILSFAAGAGTAELTYELVATAHHSGGRFWLALALCCVACDLVTTALVFGIVATTGGRVDRRVLGGAFLGISLSVPVNVGLAILTALIMRASLWGLSLVGAMLLGTSIVLRRQYDLESKYDNLELLYGFTHRLSGLTEATDVVTTALRTVADLLNCDQVELIGRRGGTFERTAVHPSGALIHSDDYQPGPLERRVLETGEPLLVPRGAKGTKIAEHLVERGWRDVVIVPVRGTSSIEGVLVAADRLGETSTFTLADQRLLETLAAHSSVALRGSELLDRLRDEVKARSYEALHDSLTGLANRKLFRQRLENTLDRSGSKPVAVVMFDLDNFKEINDTLGHHTGDGILREVADRISAAVGEAGVACRIGGDEFAVIVPDPGSADAAIAIAQEARDALAAPLVAESMTFSLQAAVGVAVAPEDGGDAGSLLRRADVAMYAAKADKSGVERYDPARDPNTTRRLRLTSDLRKAIEDDGIELWYQPKAELTSGRVVGVEALARWNHDRYGFIPPDEFVPIAELSGSIGALTSLVLDKAIRQKRDWARMGLQLDMAVNISARNLLDTELVSRLQRLIGVYGINANGLIVELTESSVMSDAERAERILGELAQVGVRIAVDDFGTGYSSLSRLSRLPVSEIKVDKSFVTNMLSSNTEPIVAATIELAASLGQDVTAEGVEDRATWERLRDLGCNFVQGYFLARPMQADAATKWLTDAGLRRSLLRPA